MNLGCCLPTPIPVKNSEFSPKTFFIYHDNFKKIPPERTWNCTEIIIIHFYKIFVKFYYSFSEFASEFQWTAMKLWQNVSHWYFGDIVPKFLWNFIVISLKLYKKYSRLLWNYDKISNDILVALYHSFIKFVSEFQ